MTAAIIALSVVATTLGGLVAWLVRGRLLAAEAIAKATLGERDAVARAQRAEAERDSARSALDAADADIEILEEQLNAQPHPNRDLDRSDVRGRVRRLQRRWSADPIPAARGALPTGPAAPVPAQPAAEPAGAAAVPGDGRVFRRG